MSEVSFKEVEETKVASFVVDNDQKAEWCLRKIQDAENDKEFWKAFYAEQYKAVEETADATIANMKAMLRDYFDMKPHKVTATQENYKLPSGKLVLKKRDPEFEKDEATVIEWLKKNEQKEFVKVKESLDWAGLKKTVTILDDCVATSEGEIVPGIKVTQREPIFDVEVKSK